MEKYETPEIEIIEFDAEDIITTSDGEMQPVSWRLSAHPPGWAEIFSMKNAELRMKKCGERSAFGAMKSLRAKALAVKYRLATVWNRGSRGVVVTGCASFAPALAELVLCGLSLAPPFLLSTKSLRTFRGPHIRQVSGMLRIRLCDWSFAPLNAMRIIAIHWAKRKFMNEVQFMMTKSSIHFSFFIPHSSFLILRRI